MVQFSSFFAGLKGKQPKAEKCFSFEKQHKIEREQFQSVLESFSATRIDERLQVLDLFLSIEKHLTLTELQEVVRAKFPELDDRDFLQETMEMFCLFGFAQKRSFDSREALYEHHHLGLHHDHFICIRCGHIQEFANDDLEELQISIAGQYGFHPLQHKMEIYGLCGKCMRQRETTLPLIMAARGEKVKIVQIVGGRGAQARLADMGLTLGVCLEVISNHPSGPFIVASKETRLAITGGLAKKILVTHSCHHAEE